MPFAHQTAGSGSKSADQHRRSMFKKTISSEDGRRKRTENAIQIRKNKRLEGLRKRRAMARKPAVGSLAALANTAASSSMPTEVSLEHLPMYQAAINSSDATQQYEGTKQVRRLLSRETSPPVKAVIDSGILPRFVQFLGRQEKPELQFEAAWALTNVASTEHTSVVVDMGVIPQLSVLLRSPNPDVREQSLWCLGNIAGDCIEYRDAILRTPGALDNLLLNINHPQNKNMLRNATWALSNFARGKPAPSLDVLAPAIPVVAQLLTSTDEEVITDACWTMSYISDGEDSRVKAVVDAGVTPHLVHLLNHPNDTVITPALRSIGNLVSGRDEETEAVIQAGALASLVALLRSSRRNIRKEACWALSNVAAGTNAQVQALLTTNNSVTSLLENLEKGEWAVQKEATWAICNIVTSATTPQIRTLVQMRTIEVLCTVLDKHNAGVVEVVLDALAKILRVGEADDNQEFADKVEECGGLDLIEALQDHENDRIYQKAASLLTTYFESEETEADADIAPEVDANGTFGFGVTAPGGGDVFGFASVQ